MLFGSASESFVYFTWMYIYIDIIYICITVYCIQLFDILYTYYMWIHMQPQTQTHKYARNPKLVSSHPSSKALIVGWLVLWAFWVSFSQCWWAVRWWQWKKHLGFFGHGFSKTSPWTALLFQKWGREFGNGCFGADFLRMVIPCNWRKPCIFWWDFFFVVQQVLQTWDLLNHTA